MRREKKVIGSHRDPLGIGSRPELGRSYLVKKEPSKGRWNGRSFSRGKHVQMTDSATFTPALPKAFKCRIIVASKCSFQRIEGHMIQHVPDFVKQCEGGMGSKLRYFNSNGQAGTGEAMVTALVAPAAIEHHWDWWDIRAPMEAVDDIRRMLQFAREGRRLDLQYVPQLHVVCPEIDDDPFNSV